MVPASPLLWPCDCSGKRLSRALERFPLHAMCSLSCDAECLGDLRPRARRKPVQTIPHAKHFAFAAADHGKHEQKLVAAPLGHVSIPSLTSCPFGAPAA